MPDQGPTRKLAAILSADVQGYSRLMGDDEAATVRTIETYRETVAAIINQYRGRVVDSPGDNILAEFASVVDAVQCAVEIQKVLKAKNEELPADRRMQFRIGINLGDVILEGERIYGDGVNIAARIEGLADAGGICLSGSAFEQIETKLALGYEYMGKHTVKNISKPVRVYRIPVAPSTARQRRKERIKLKLRRPHALLAVLVIVFILFGMRIFVPREAHEPGKIREKVKQALVKPGKLTIAVLPFVNLSGDPEQEYFSDGITENIITGLSKIPSLLVIARSSSFTYKGESVTIKQVGRDLKVRYVLEGSVQQAGGKVRINAQLIDADTEQHLWAERYDRNLKDIFTLQDEITLEIIKALQVELTGVDTIRGLASGTDNLEAYLKLLEALRYFRHPAPDQMAKARKVALEVITLDPDYPKGYALLALTFLNDAMSSSGQKAEESLKYAFGLTEKVIGLDPSSPDGYVLAGHIYLLQNEQEKAEIELKKALALNPNSAEANFALGRMHLWMGQPLEALALLRKAVRLDPIFSQKVQRDIGQALCYLGRYEEAIDLLRKASRENPGLAGLRIELAVCYSALGKKKKARAEMRAVLERQPGLSLERYSNRVLFKDQKYREAYLDLLRQAGLK